jgi:hypothetical protein
MARISVDVHTEPIRQTPTKWMPAARVGIVFLYQSLRTDPARKRSTGSEAEVRADHRFSRMRKSAG